MTVVVIRLDRRSLSFTDNTDTINPLRGHFLVLLPYKCDFPLSIPVWDSRTGILVKGLEQVDVRNVVRFKDDPQGLLTHRDEHVLEIDVRS